VSRLKTLVRNEAGTPPLRGGHALCQGCGIPMVVRTIVDTIETPVVVASLLLRIDPQLRRDGRDG